MDPRMMFAGMAGMQSVNPTLLGVGDRVLFRPDAETMQRRAALEKLARRGAPEDRDPYKSLFAGYYRTPQEVTLGLGLNAMEKYSVEQKLGDLASGTTNAARFRQDLAQLAQLADMDDTARRVLQQRGLEFYNGLQAQKSLRKGEVIAFPGKGGGEGSRGGKIIGHYPSGAPIYQASKRSSKAPGGHDKADHEAAQAAHEKQVEVDPHGNSEKVRGATLEAVYHHASASGNYEKPVGRTRAGKMIYHPYSQKYAALHQRGSDAGRINALNERLGYTAQDHQDADEEHRSMARQTRKKKGSEALAQHYEQTSQAHALAPEKGAVSKSLPQLLIKAAGARGGKYIKREGTPGNYRYTYAETAGTTSSGKAVTSAGQHEAASGYSKQDHVDAQNHHVSQAKQLRTAIAQAQGQGRSAPYHEKLKSDPAFASDKMRQVLVLTDAQKAHTAAANYHAGKAAQTGSPAKEPKAAPVPTPKASNAPAAKPEPHQMDVSDSIGKTRSGKPIPRIFGHDTTEGYTAEDHDSAASKHRQDSNRIEQLSMGWQGRHLGNAMDSISSHDEQASRHEAAAASMRANPKPAATKPSLPTMRGDIGYKNLRDSADDQALAESGKAKNAVTTRKRAEDKFEQGKKDIQARFPDFDQSRHKEAAEQHFAAAKRLEGDHTSIAEKNHHKAIAFAHDELSRGELPQKPSAKAAAKDPGFQPTPMHHPAYKDIRNAAEEMGRVESLKYDEPEHVVEGVNNAYAKAADAVRAAFPHLTPKQHEKLAEHHDAESHKAFSRPGVQDPRYMHVIDHRPNNRDGEHHQGIAMLHRYLAQHPKSGTFRPYHPSDYREEEEDYDDDDFHRSMSKATTSVHGLPVTVERKAGKLHHWKARDGSSGTKRQLFDYGYIDKTKGADGEEYDVYVGPAKNAKMVYIAHQNRVGSGKYDEDKAMLGFNSEAEARAAYLASYGGKESMLRNITSMPVDAFKRMVRTITQKSSAPNPNGTESDSAAAIRGAEIARRLKDKLDGAKGKSMKKSLTLGGAPVTLSKARYTKREGSPGHYKYTYADDKKKPAPEATRKPHWSDSVREQEEAEKRSAASAPKSARSGKTDTGKVIPKSSDASYGNMHALMKEHGDDIDEHHLAEGASKLKSKTQMWTEKDHEQASDHHMEAHDALAEKRGESSEHMISKHSAAAIAHQHLAQGIEAQRKRVNDSTKQASSQSIGKTSSGKTVHGAGHDKYKGIGSKKSADAAQMVADAHPNFSHDDHINAARLHNAKGSEHGPSGDRDRKVARAHSKAADLAKKSLTDFVTVAGQTFNLSKSEQQGNNVANSISKADTVDVGGDPLAFLGMKTVDLSTNSGNGASIAGNNPGAPDTTQGNSQVASDAPTPPTQALSPDDLATAYLANGGRGVGQLTASGTYQEPPNATMLDNGDVPQVDPMNLPMTVLSEMADGQGDAQMTQMANQHQPIQKSHFWTDDFQPDVVQYDAWMAQPDLISKGNTLLTTQVICKSCSTPRQALLSSCDNCGEGVTFSKSFCDEFMAKAQPVEPEVQPGMVDCSQGINLNDWK